MFLFSIEMHITQGRLHHPAASAGNEFTISRHTGRSAMAAGRSWTLMPVSLDMTSGYVSLFERLGPGGVQRRSDEMTSSLAL